MANNAIGLLETKGLIPLVTGVDAMLKAANVTLNGPMKGVGSALVAATVTGDVAAVKAALEAGAKWSALMSSPVPPTRRSRSSRNPPSLARQPSKQPCFWHVSSAKSSPLKRRLT